MNSSLLGLLAFGAMAAVVSANSPNDQPIELGHVPWERDFEKGLAATAESGRPALLLFQEVPG